MWDTHPSLRSSVPLTAWLGVLVVTTVLNRCARAPGGHDSPDGVVPLVKAAEVIDGYDCLASNPGDWTLPPGSPGPLHPDAPAAGRVPADFIPSMSVRCEQAASIEDAEGQWSAVAAVGLTGDLTRLLEASAEPDDATSLGPCTADMEMVPPLWLVDMNGRAMLTHHSRNGCSNTKLGVHDALAALARDEREFSNEP